MLSLQGAHLVAALNPLSSTSLLGSLGALGVFLVVFAETGLLIGFFLPGDSLLFTAGLLCTATSGHQVHLSLPVVLLAAAAGALLGAQTGFYIGRIGGRPVLERSRHRYLRKGAERASELLARYGYGKAIVLARFIPIVRTVLNPLAGALQVPVRTFTIWQIAGGLVWSVGVTLAGYALGSAIPSIEIYLLPVIAVIVVVSLIPIGIELRRTRAAARTNPGADGGTCSELRTGQVSRPFSVPAEPRSQAEAGTRSGDHDRPDIDAADPARERGLASYSSRGSGRRSTDATWTSPTSR